MSIKPGISMVGAVVRIPRVRVRPFPNQPREYFDHSALQELAQSIGAIGQQVPVTVKEVEGDPLHDYELIDGQRRWLACGMVGIQTMLVWIDTVADEEEQFLKSVVSNFGRSGHTVMETARAIKRIKNSKDLTHEEVSKIFGRSIAWITQYLSLLNLDPPVQKMLEPMTPENERLTMSHALLLTNLKSDAQNRLAKTFVKDQVGLNKARILVNRLIEAEGVEVKRVARNRRPSDIYDIFHNFIRRLNNDAEVILETPLSMFKRMFELRRSDERRFMMKKINDCIEQLEQLKQILVDMNPDSAEDRTRNRGVY